tara:strand:- start:1237 stop:2676 length:1440 start_codon:yes stop_codon:yes gene_type:complete
MMRKFIHSLVIAVLISGSTYAQLPSGSIAPDFTITDLEGVEHQLYDILDEGKPVLLDLFAVWCGPCWSFAQTGVFEDFNEVYGNSVLVLAAEADPSTDVSALYGGSGSIGDWTSIIDYPLANDDSIADLYQLGYYPTIYLICPDRTVTEIGQTSSGSYWTVPTLAQEVFNYTCDPIDGINAGIQSYNSEVNYCGDVTVEPVITISNTGSEMISSFIIETIVDGDVVSEFEWAGFLPILNTEQIVLEEVPANTNLVAFNIVIDGDVVAADNAISVELSNSVEAHSFIHVEVNTDSQPSDTSWEIIDLNGQVLMSESYLGGSENAYLTHNHSASLAEGCYTFRALDSSGDGQSSNAGGSIVVNDAEGLELLSVSGDWGDLQAVTFEVTHGVGIEEIVENTASIFPNPASNNATVAFNLIESNEIVIEVVNTLGQKVVVQSLTKKAGENTVTLPVETLTTGLYYVNIKIANEMITEKLNIIK